MKVILLRDVAKIGKKFSVVEVPDGFALNKLIPARDAEPASPANLKRIRERATQSAVATASDIAAIQKIHDRYAAAPLRIKMQANEQGHLFQGVHASEIIAAALADGVTIEASALTVPNQIKTLGTHAAQLAVGKTVLPLALEVVAK